jgi:hypothetical protein
MGREVRRVPIDFDWPQGETWAGFFNPFYKFRSDCPSCGGTGYTPEARRFQDQWYGDARFDPAAYGATPLTVDLPEFQAFAARNVGRDPVFYRVDALGCDRAIRREAERLFGLWKGQWSHHLIQADVDALVASGRFHDFTHTWTREAGWRPIEPPPVVTADDVNAWSLSGMGHDGINQSICVRARCEREGFAVECPACEGHGDSWPSKAHEALYESWQDIAPPTGDAYQMWETTSEGSPISPPFATPEDLARWLADTGASAMGGQGASYESWLRVCRGGYAPSMVAVDGVMTSGVEGLGQADPAA